MPSRIRSSDPRGSVSTIPDARLLPRAGRRVLAVRPGVEDRAFEECQTLAPTTAEHERGPLRDQGHRDDPIEAEWFGERHRPIGQADRLGHLLVAERSPGDGLDEQGRGRIRLRGIGPSAAGRLRSLVASASAASRKGRATSIAVAIWALPR